jgi:hypothetical protein
MRFFVLRHVLVFARGFIKAFDIGNKGLRGFKSFTGRAVIFIYLLRDHLGVENKSPFGVAVTIQVKARDFQADVCGVLVNAIPPFVVA